jgi:hypothetical protein
MELKYYVVSVVEVNSCLNCPHYDVADGCRNRIFSGHYTAEEYEKIGSAIPGNCPLRSGGGIKIEYHPDEEEWVGLMDAAKHGATNVLLEASGAASLEFQYAYRRLVSGNKIKKL